MSKEEFEDEPKFSVWSKEGSELVVVWIISIALLSLISYAMYLFISKHV